MEGGLGAEGRLLEGSRSSHRLGAGRSVPFPNIPAAEREFVSSGSSSAPGIHHQSLLAAALRMRSSCQQLLLHGDILTRSRSSFP